ncbi:unnamed protein product [Owenia fusiformis]|uniref:Carbohydrate sulfotransferase n=1 Tax=Owenia fusiformis TaxID=6347 RepID=A0A8J1UB56_OWEFU|nr:unnamed protein product [Owenia fusiformis]
MYKYSTLRAHFWKTVTTQYFVFLMLGLIYWRYLLKNNAPVEIQQIYSQFEDTSFEESTDENNSSSANESYCKWDIFPRLRKVFNTRRQHLKDACAKLNSERQNKTYGFLFVDDAHKLLICPVAKIGCSFWKAVLLILSHRTGEKNPLDVLTGVHSKEYPQLRLDPPDVQKRKMDTYTKVIFTRDPLSRLYSAYQDKFVNFNTLFWNMYGKLAVRLFRENATRKSLSNGHDVTFEEFLRLVVLNSEMDKINSHWVSVEQSCHPCDVDYDVIGHMETFDKDAKYVLCTSGMQNIIQLPSEDKTANILKNVRRDTFRALSLKSTLLKVFGTEKEFLDRLVSNFMQHGYINSPVTIPLNSTSKDTFALLEKHVKLEAKHPYKLLASKHDPSKDIPRDLLDKVMDLYKFDYELFGYKRQ